MANRPEVGDLVQRAIIGSQRSPDSMTLSEQLEAEQLRERLGPVIMKKLTLGSGSSYDPSRHEGSWDTVD